MKTLFKELHVYGMLLAMMAVLFVPTASCYAEWIVWRSPAGDVSAVDIAPQILFSDVIAMLESEIQGGSFELEGLPKPEFLIDFTLVTNSHTKGGKAAGQARRYDELPTDQQKKDIAFIVTTLGNASLGTIATSKSALKKAGVRVENVHPWHFLMVVFRDEKLKAALHNLQGRTIWIWSEFFNGLKRGLDEEFARDNLLRYVDDFAENLQIDSSLLYPSIEARSWKGLLDALMVAMPRGENVRRYNM